MSWVARGRSENVPTDTAVFTIITCASKHPPTWQYFILRNWVMAKKIPFAIFVGIVIQIVHEWRKVLARKEKWYVLMKIKVLWILLSIRHLYQRCFRFLHVICCLSTWNNYAFYYNCLSMWLAMLSGQIFRLTRRIRKKQCPSRSESLEQIRKKTS